MPSVADATRRSPESSPKLRHATVGEKGGRVDPERDQGGDPSGAAGVAGHARQASRGVKVGQRDLVDDRSRASVL
jgi:hypothetical protein